MARFAAERTHFEGCEQRPGRTVRSGRAALSAHFRYDLGHPKLAWACPQDVPEPGWAERTKAVSALGEPGEMHGTPLSATMDNVRNSFIPDHRTWAKSARYVVPSAVGPESTDGGPSGGTEAFSRIADDKTFLPTDWRGASQALEVNPLTRDDNGHVVSTDVARSLRRARDRFWQDPVLRKARPRSSPASALQPMPATKLAFDSGLNSVQNGVVAEKCDATGRKKA